MHTYCANCAFACRWWPCEICHPRHVPDNVLAMRHDVGEFAIRYFGTNEYYWTHHGRCNFLYVVSVRYFLLQERMQKFCYVQNFRFISRLKICILLLSVPHASTGAWDIEH